MYQHCRQILLALALICLLTAPALAEDGIIWPGIAPPPPATAGVIYTDAPDTLTQLALNLIPALVARF